MSRDVLTSEEVCEANEAIDAYSRQLLEHGTDEVKQGKEQVFDGKVVRTGGTAVVG
jgi:hypothetical protein